jgi:outer membrane protein OmpA-like peptidoglycan-associated protein
MSRLSGLLLAVVAAIVLAAPASAQIAGQPYEISGGAGLFNFDTRARLKDTYVGQGAVGWRFSPHTVLEAHALFAPSEADSGAEPRRNFSYGGLDLRWNLRPADARVVPFVLTGVGYGLSHSEGADPAKLERGAATLGLGVLMNVVNQRTFFRLQARDILFRERDAKGFSNHLGVTAGLQYHFGGKPKDVDVDGVRDWLDRCPETPFGATVDAHGCPVDSDGDKVWDGLDRCEATPAGCVTDSTGCPVDSDGDGVCDGLDQCADTPRGARVNTQGCPADGDGDGVLDGLDSCATTPPGCSVDANGCESDADGDGVCDGVDQCPYTPAGMRVDEKGCPALSGPREAEFLEKGVLVLPRIEFESRRSVLKAESYPLLDAVSKFVPQYVDYQLELGGYTDDIGDPDGSQRMSVARARAVLDYIRDKAPGLDASKIAVKGYGATADTSYAGRLGSRRVELKSLLPDSLRLELPKRMPVLREPAPADTTRR